MYNLDKKQIKRMTVEVTNFDPEESTPARITIRLWNATSSPLYNLPAPYGGERNAPVHVIFPDVDIAAPPTFNQITGILAVVRGASAGVMPDPTIAHTELIFFPDLNAAHDTALVVFEIGQFPLDPGLTFMVECGNATYVGDIDVGSR